MRILYVEDDPRDADLAARKLRKAMPACKLEIASTLADAEARLETFDNSPLDLVLTDVHLPDGSGLSLLTQIRDTGLPTAVVIITGSGDEETAVAALKAGADDYVVKRKDYLERLPLTIESALHHYQAGAARRARPLKVLYAEHDSVDADLTRRHFDRHAHHIQMDVVSSGPEAVSRLNGGNCRGSYDVLLLDYRLPGLDALELLKELRLARKIDVPVVLVTGQGSEEVALQAIKLGASSYVVKNPGYLYQLVGEVENANFHSELTRREEALRINQSRYQLATSAGKVGVWDWHIESGEVYVDPVLKSILGYGEHEISNRLDDWSKYFHP